MESRGKVRIRSSKLEKFKELFKFFDKWVRIGSRFSVNKKNNDEIIELRRQNNKTWKINRPRGKNKT